MANSEVVFEKSTWNDIRETFSQQWDLYSKTTRLALYLSDRLSVRCVSRVRSPNVTNICISNYIYLFRVWLFVYVVFLCLNVPMTQELTIK